MLHPLNIIQGAARRNRYIFATQKICHLEAVKGMVDAYISTRFIGFDPRRQVGVPYSKKGKAVNVGYLKLVLFDYFFQAGQCIHIKIRRIEMGSVTHDFDPLETQSGDFFYSFKK